jgi:MFS family permease
MIPEMSAQFKRTLQKVELANVFSRLGKNARICVLTEPLWAIPNAIYAPFVSIYMSALGLSDAMIGLVGTLALISQVLFSLLGGVLTDKLGRRRCTFLFDMLAWSVPTLLWALARDAWWFAAAALFNGAWRVTANSWELLLVEDEDEGVLVKLFAMINIAVSLSAAGVLLSYPLMNRFTLIPTVRGMYILAFVMMTAKFIILYARGHETRIGLRRMEEVRGRSTWSMLKESKAALARMLRTPRTVLTLALMACFTGGKNLTDMFWPLLVVERAGASSEAGLALFSAARSVVMLLCYFLIAPRVSADRFKRPLVLCFLIQAATKLALIFMPSGALALLWITVLLDAFSLALLNPLTESLQLMSMDAHQRASTLAMFFAVMLLVTSPLSAIGGALSEINRSLPFVLTLALHGLAIWAAIKIWALGDRETAPKVGAADV